MFSYQTSSSDTNPLENLFNFLLLLDQAGGHGTCITQCRSAKIVTRKTIPMQVDGEATRLNPATIDLAFFNQVGHLDSNGTI